MISRWAALTAAVLCLQGQAAAWERVATIVTLPRPETATDQALVTAFKEAAPLYQAVSGLERKSFLYTDDIFGGAYLWADQEAARAFFDEGWQARMRETYGQLPTITWFKAPLTTAAAGFGQSGEDAVVATVLAKAPWYAPGFVIRNRMRASLPIYTELDELDFKIFVIDDNKRVGGIYLWHDQDAADGFYNDTWRQRIVETYGEEADLQFFRTPLTIVNAEPSS